MHKLLNRIFGKHSDFSESPDRKEKQPPFEFSEEQKESLSRTLRLQEEQAHLINESITTISESLSNSEKREKLKFYMDVLMLILFIVFVIYLFISIQRS